MPYPNPPFPGQGWKFPVEIEPMTGRIKMSGEYEDIQESIRIILLTQKGERVMNPEFGCGIHEFVFNRMDTTRRAMLEKEVLSALTRWEPRIQNMEVSITPDPQEPEKYLIQIRCEMISTGQIFSLIYPFYVHSGL
jgi:phage baseplate assembly protein W